MNGFLDALKSWFWPNPQWAPGTLPNPWATPTDPAADGSASDPYHDGQWAPLIAPVASHPEADQLRATAYVPPYSGPLDLDDYGRETEAMRRAYRDDHRAEPAIRSAIDGKAAAVAALDVAVVPDDPKSPDDVKAAAFVDWTVTRTPHGWDGLILSILRPALIDGFSVAEKVLRVITEPGKWHGFWGLRHVKSKDTAYLTLRLDGFRNVLGVVNLIRGMRTYAPGKTIIFTHAGMFNSPFGQSDLRAAYRAARQIQDAYKLWYLALKRFGQPYLHGLAQSGTLKKEMLDALQRLRDAGLIVTGKEDEVRVIDLAAAASFEAFEKKVRVLREDIFLAIRGAYTPFMQSNTGGGEATGSAAVSQHVGSDPLEYALARAGGRCLTDQLVPDLVRPNFGYRVGLPRVVLGGVNWAEMKQRVEVLKSVSKDLGIRLKKSWVLGVLEIPPADDSDPDDVIPPPKPQPGGQGAGGTTMAAADDLAGGEIGWRTFAEFNPAKHPRGYDGRFIETEHIQRAKKDPEYAEYLRAHLPKDERPKLDAALRPPPSNLLVLANQQEEWRKRFDAIGVKIEFVPETAGVVRIVLPDSARNPETHDKIDALLSRAGLSDDRAGGAEGRTEAKNALYRGSADTVDPPGYGDRALVFLPGKGLAVHVKLKPPGERDPMRDALTAAGKPAPDISGLAAGLEAAIKATPAPAAVVAPGQAGADQYAAGYRRARIRDGLAYLLDLDKDRIAALTPEQREVYMTGARAAVASMVDKVERDEKDSRVTAAVAREQAEEWLRHYEEFWDDFEKMQALTTIGFGKGNGGAGVGRSAAGRVHQPGPRVRSPRGAGRSGSQPTGEPTAPGGETSPGVPEATPVRPAPPQAESKPTEPSTDGGKPASGEAGQDPPNEQKAAPPEGSSRPLFRGDIDHKPGSKPIGKQLNPDITDAERAEIAYDHVKENLDSGESIFTSWSESGKTARDKFAKWKPSDKTGDPKRVTKVSLDDLRKLEQQGKIKIYNPDQVYDLIVKHGGKKIAKGALGIRDSMVRNNELLVEGEIPTDVQSAMK